MLPALLPQFDLALARSLAKYASRAYAPQPCAEKVGSSCVTFQDAATAGLVLIEDIGDALVLAFRGTKEIRNWLTDADFIKTPIGSGKAAVHRGFFAGWNALEPKIVACLAGTQKSLIICGHSLGGAEATLAAYELQLQNFPIRAVYTYASPRVGNVAFRQAYNDLLGEKTFRVAAAGDLVPLAPGIFCPPTDGYRHVGREVLLTQGLGGIDERLAVKPHALVEPSHYMEMAMDGWAAYRAFKRADFDFILRKHSIDRDYIPLLASIS